MSKDINIYDGERHYSFERETHTVGIEEGVLTVTEVTTDGYRVDTAIKFAPGAWKRVEFTRE